MADKAQAGKSQTEAEKRINFSVLKKHDDKIDKIIDTASSVAHYKFNSTSGNWVSFSKIVFAFSIVISKTKIFFRVYNLIRKRITRSFMFF